MNAYSRRLSPNVLETAIMGPIAGSVIVEAADQLRASGLVRGWVLDASRAPSYEADTVAEIGRQIDDLQRLGVVWIAIVLPLWAQMYVPFIEAALQGKGVRVVTFHSEAEAFDWIHKGCA